jgi:hypothetical protein
VQEIRGDPKPPILGLPRIPLLTGSQAHTLANLLEIEDNIPRRRDRPMATALAAPNVAGYSFDQAPDLTDAQERRKLSESAIKVFVNIARKWELNEAQARAMLGGVASSTFHSWKTRPKGKQLDQDTLTRISLVIGIYKALHIYFGKPWADRWITLKNRGPLFAGHAPIDYMIRHGQPGMAEVRRMLDAWRGGR